MRLGKISTKKINRERAEIEYEKKRRTEAFTVRALVKDSGESFSSEACVWGK